MAFVLFFIYHLIVTGYNSDVKAIDLNLQLVSLPNVVMCVFTFPFTIFL